MVRLSVGKVKELPVFPEGPYKVEVMFVEKKEGMTGTPYWLLHLHLMGTNHFFYFVIADHVNAEWQWRDLGLRSWIEAPLVLHNIYIIEVGVMEGTPYVPTRNTIRAFLAEVVAPNGQSYGSVSRQTKYEARGYTDGHITFYPE